MNSGGPFLSVRSSAFPSSRGDNTSSRERPVINYGTVGSLGSFRRTVVPSADHPALSRPVIKKCWGPAATARWIAIAHSVVRSADEFSGGSGPQQPGDLQTP